MFKLCWKNVLPQRANINKTFHIEQRSRVHWGSTARRLLSCLSLLGFLNSCKHLQFFKETAHVFTNSSNHIDVISSTVFFDVCLSWLKMAPTYSFLFMYGNVYRKIVSPHNFTPGFCQLQLTTWICRFNCTSNHFNWLSRLWLWRGFKRTRHSDPNQFLQGKHEPPQKLWTLVCGDSNLEIQK